MPPCSRERFFAETRKPDDGDAGEHRRGGLTKPACREAALAAAPPRIAAATGKCPAEMIASEASPESLVNNAG
jgi:hypothetical protein